MRLTRTLVQRKLFSTQCVSLWRKRSCLFFCSSDSQKSGRTLRILESKKRGDLRAAFQTAVRCVTNADKALHLGIEECGDCGTGGSVHSRQRKRGGEHEGDWPCKVCFFHRRSRLTISNWKLHYVTVWHSLLLLVPSLKVVWNSPRCGADTWTSAPSRGCFSCGTIQRRGWKYGNGTCGAGS